MLVSKIRWAVVIFVTGILSMGVVVGMAKKHSTLSPSKAVSSKSRDAGRRYAFYYFKDVIDMAHPNNQIQMTIARDSNGHEVYSLWNRRNNQRFRDEAQINDNIKRLIDGKSKKLPGTMHTVLPLGLFAEFPANVYLNKSDAAAADNLGVEMKRWRKFLNSCDLIMDAKDVLPTSTARQYQTYDPIKMQKKLYYVVSQTFTNNGARKMEKFTSTHKGAIMGIVLDGRVLSAPYIMSAIKDKGELSGCMKNLAEAQAMADRMNTIAVESRK